MIFYGDFQSLRLAVDEDPSKENLLRLSLWCEHYGQSYWNGECYDVSLPSEPSGTCSLYPIYECFDDDDFCIVGYELR